MRLNLRLLLSIACILMLQDDYSPIAFRGMFDWEMEQSLPFFSRRFLLSNEIRLQLRVVQKPLYLASRNVTGHFVQIGI